MKKIVFISLFLCLFVSFTFSQRVYLPNPDSKPIQPVLDDHVTDVYVLNASDGYYYMTGTWVGNETMVPLWKSKDLKDWELSGSILKTDWAIAAPELYEWENTFYLLVTEKQGTSIYRSEEIAGDYTFHARLSDSVVDASIFIEDEKHYLVYGGGIIAGLSTDLSEISSAPELLHPSFDLERPVAPGWATEKAQFIKVGTRSARIVKESGRYYLFASDYVTRLNDRKYDILCASSDSLKGPYTRRRLAFMHAGGGSVFKGKDGEFYCAFSGQSNDLHIRVNKKPIIAKAKISSDGLSMGYSGECYFEKEPIGNTRNRMPEVIMRDPSICTGPDGWHYLVATENWLNTEFGKPRIMLRRSKDLKVWEEVNQLVDCDDLGTQFDGTPLGFKEGERVMMWAPEIQYIHSKGVFMLSVSIPRIPNGGGMQTWIFKGYSPKGPFKNISSGAMHKGIDGFFYEENGKVYYLYGANSIVEMNDDLTGFNGEFRELKGLHGIEGMSLVKINGKYLLSRSDNTGGPGTATYEAIYGVSDSVWGPYKYRGSVSHCGHTTMFLGHDGKWRMTMFGSDSHAPVHHGLGILQFELDENDQIQLTEDL